VVPIAEPVKKIHVDNRGRCGKQGRRKRKVAYDSVVPKDGAMEYLNEKPTPSVITSLLDRRRQLAPDERCRLEEELKLSFYYGQMGCVAFRRQDRGIEILATGSTEEVAKDLQKLGLRGTENCPISILKPQAFEKVFIRHRDASDASRPVAGAGYRA
jgi:hypothetical protein